MANYNVIRAEEIGSDVARNIRADRKYVVNNTVSTAGFRNHVQNGQFEVWQRGTTVTPATGTNVAVFWADRWLCQTYTGTGGAAGSGFTVSRQTHTVGQTDVPYSPRYFHRLTINSMGATQGAGAFNRVSQLIEDTMRLTGSDVTISFWAKADSARNGFISVHQQFGTGGSASVVVSGSVLGLTTGWKKFTLTFKYPNVAGKTIGSEGTVPMLVIFGLFSDSANAWVPGVSGNLGTVAAGNLDLSDVQVESGSVPTPPERRPYDVELAMCKRFYQRYTDPHMVGVVGVTTTVGRLGMMLPVTMRIAPTFTIIGTPSLYDGAATSVITSFGPQYLGPDRVQFDINMPSTWSVTGRTAIVYQGPGVIWEFSADL
jgi:hypothetical protein